MEKDLLILHLVLAADTSHYREIETAAKETWNSNNPNNIKTIYMYGDNDSISYDGKDSFYVDKKEGLDICLYKTICAFEYFLKFDFDYIFRSNITGYFDYQVMNDFLKDKSLDNFYCGIVGSHGSISFASGSGFFISRNLVENIVKNKDTLYLYLDSIPQIYPNIPAKWCDDVAIGKYITQDLGISIDTSSRRINLTLDQIDDNLDMNQYHYRILNKGDFDAIHKIHSLKKMQKPVVIFSSDSNPDYSEFAPLVSEMWRELNFEPFYAKVGSDQFPLIEGVSSSLQSQIVRLYATKLFLDRVTLITDIDMLPFDQNYFWSKLPTEYDQISIYSADAYGGSRYPMCYLSAYGKTFSSIVLDHKDETWEEFVGRLNALNLGWNTDELYVTKRIDSSNVEKIKYNREWINGLAKKRLDRAQWRIGEDSYIDAHCPRPYSKYKDSIDSLKRFIKVKKMTNKIISMSLWGNNPQYCDGAIKNAIIAKDLLPDWKCRIFIDETVPYEYQKKLYDMDNVEIAQLNDDSLYGMFWRFYSMFQSDDDIVLSRDCDSRITEREVRCINEWLESGKKFSIIRDHIRHYDWPMMGGMWGVRGKLSDDIFEEMQKYSKRHQYIIDQVFLKEVVWEIAKEDCMIHGFQEVEWMKDRSETDFVGQGYTRNDEPLYNDVGQKIR